MFDAPLQGGQSCANPGDIVVVKWHYKALETNLLISQPLAFVYSDVIISAMASQIIGSSIVCSTVCSCADQVKTSKLRVTGLCEWKPPHKGPVTRKMFPFDDVIMHLMLTRYTYCVISAYHTEGAADMLVLIWHRCIGNNYDSWQNRSAVTKIITFCIPERQNPAWHQCHLGL